MLKGMNLAAAAAALALGLVASAAVADDEGESGEIATVTLLGSSADLYIQYHGSVIVKETNGGALSEYRWGGTSCGSKVLTEQQVARLLDLASAPYMRIIPIHESGAGENECLVGFRAFNAKFE